MSIAELSLFAAIPLAFAAGLVSFLSPCVAPLVPGYLAFIAHPDEALVPLNTRQRRGLRLTRAVAFVAGFTAVFTLLGASSAGAAAFLKMHSVTLAFFAGTIVALLGIATIFDRSPLAALGNGRITQRLARPTTIVGAVIVGTALAVAWTPCIGPVLAGILAIAGSTGDTTRGALLLAVYSLGLGVPFIAAALMFDTVMKGVQITRRWVRVIRITCGVILLVVGVAIASGAFGRLASELARAVPSFAI